MVFVNNLLSAQNENSDTTNVVRLDEVVITANRVPVKLSRNPGSISLVTPGILAGMPKGAAVEEALRLVPGVRIDNQHDGERVHVSIRGQGILTERGLRGIGVLIDGIPLNDPSGFAPDLYDADWSTVRKVEVLRGPAAGLYGGGGAAGILNVTTRDGGNKPIGGELSQTFGSNGYRKSLLELGGTSGDVNYRVSYSRTGGDGYRDHQAFWANKLYEKITWRPGKKLTVSQVFSKTGYFQQNPEGLNLGQFDNLRQANPDACPFNEYQKTSRTTAGLTASYRFSALHDLQVSGYLRGWNYKETSNRCAEYRNYSVPGATAQYNLHLGTGKVRHNISLGADLRRQDIAIYKLQSASNPGRVESIDETNLETRLLLANQLVNQASTGIFGVYQLEAGKFSVIGSLRYDDMNNSLTDKMAGPDTATTAKDFSRISGRIGASYGFSQAATLFATWSQGFMPPSTEELASNPTGYSGFNTHLVPALSACTEIGMRGFLSDRVAYELTGFMMNTQNDFFRFKQSGRGNQEVFYGNAGNSRRMGIEAFLSLKIVKNLSWQTAYTFADYRYTSASVDPVYTDPAYVLTLPPAAGQYLPNSPKHQIYSELSWAIGKNLTAGVGTEYQSKWAIYTDAKAYAGELNPDIYRNWQKGFNLWNARIAWQWNLKGLNGELSLAVRNLTGATYMAFTEPDPDGNSYQPGPGRELFGTLRIRF